MKKMLVIAGILVSIFTACKKSKPADDVNPVNVTPPDNSVPVMGTTLDMIKDSIFLYAKEDYYWYDALPDYGAFNPRSFTGTDDLTALQNEVDKLSQYKINPATSQPYEYYPASPGEAKYSFIDAGEASQRLSAVSGDFGFGIVYLTNTDLRVKYVYAGSPAGLAGLKRGDQITSINGSTAISYNTNLSFVANAYSNSSTITMVLKRTTGTTYSVTLNTAVYQVNPIITYKVLDQGNGKKVGYIVFNSFVALNSTQTALNTAFSAFTAAGITDLVVDLRYDGGGYVETAEYLDNLIAPTSVGTTSTMYNAYYNDILTSGKEVLLKKQVRRDDVTGQVFNYSQIDYSVAANQVKFTKQGTLNLTRVFFIVTGSTASASELTINNLRPYMNVQLIGSTTYGKPVGFFDIDINKYQMYIPEFETKNSAGQGGYYTGMKPGSTDYPGIVVTDDPTKEFGDPTEALLAEALSYVNKGTYSTPTLQIESTGTNKVLSADDQNNFEAKIHPHTFNGMVLTRHVLKK